MGRRSTPFDPKSPRFQDVPQLTPWGGYAVDLSWGDLERALEHYRAYEFDFGESDFQRTHVWTRDQQIAFVEFKLRGGRSGGDILCNCPGWMGERTGRMVLVDGKQRLNAVLTFLHDQIPAFGCHFSEFRDRLTMTGPSFRWHVNHLSTRAQVLRWYVDLNAGGTAHTTQEIDHVRQLLDAEG